MNYYQNSITYLPLSRYTQKLPHGQDIADLLPVQPKILEQRGIIDRMKSAIENIVEVFEW